jgi:tetratricopeptide (TPR) repeat protein
MSRFAITRDVGDPDPQAVHKMFDDALRHYETGSLAEAERLFRQILALEPSHASSWHLLGVTCYRTGRYEQAVGMIGKAIAINGEVAIFHSNLGNALCAQDKLDDAAASYQRALALEPAFAEAYNNLGYIRYLQDRYDDAIAHCKQALVLKPDYPAAHHNLANAFQAQGRLEDAIEHYERALVLEPNCADAHNNLGNALQTIGKFGDAVVCYKQALALKPGFAGCYYNLGNALQALGKFNDAIACYEKALTFKPDFAEACNNLGNVFRVQGRLGDALAQYKRAFLLKSNLAEAYNHYANLRRFCPGDVDLKTLERLAVDPDVIPANKAVYIHFALAKALEDIGEYDRAFQHLLEGNASRRREINYDKAGTEGLLARISEIFDEQLFRRFRDLGDPSQVPIFVVGMPRSGSTLIEQILASHPHVLGGGELTDFAVLTDGIGGLGSKWVRYPEYVPTLDRITIHYIGNAYLARLPTLRNDKIRITDKLLTNFIKLGLIYLIFPKARIIHIMRDPADTCVSCFATLFSEGVNFSYDLAELGRYYRRYMALMAHWRSVLPKGAFLDVVYEEVVDNLEEQARRLLSYCGLPWVDRCLSFHETTRPVSTASAAQVRQPLFRSSIKRWRRFETHLQPLLSELGDLRCAGTANSRS